MRCLVGFVCVLALGPTGCAEASGAGGNGGNGGSDGYVCRPATGEPGAGGGGYYPAEPPGIYSGEVEAVGERGRVLVRFQTSSDCSALVPSAECTIGGDDDRPVFFEIELEGLDERGQQCAAGIAVTTEMVAEVPIQDAGTLNVRFTIDITDEVGVQWLVYGQWAVPYGVEGQVRRTQGDTYCEGYWFADDGCAF